MFLYESVITAFHKSKIKYLLVGGLATNLLGVERSTSDMDILVAMTDANLRKIVMILKDLGYKVRQPVDPIGIADPTIRRDWIVNKNMKAFNFYRDESHEEVDIIIESPVSFAQAKKNAIIKRLGKISMHIISPADLIKMKKTAGRDVDRWDIVQLEKIKRIYPSRSAAGKKKKSV